ncbi:MAG TPA: hypothetical protein PKO23_06600 [Candidatus Hydrogenedentes bacterium]|jgi:hypothetical protein|nr:hypothetical protein [Candidatus Hydrogenedentota bacterium]
MKMGSLLGRTAPILLTVQFLLAVAFAKPVRWEIIPGEALRNDPAYAFALADLQNAALANGMEILPGEPGRATQQRRILVGDAARNDQVAVVLHEQGAPLKGVSSTQGFEMATLHTTDGTTLLIIAGGGIAGDIYGLYWVRDRIRACKTIPEPIAICCPGMTRRMGITSLYSFDTLIF